MGCILDFSRVFRFLAQFDYYKGNVVFQMIK